MNDADLKHILEQLEHQNKMLENIERKQQVASVYLFVIMMMVVIVPIALALPF